MSRNYQFFNLEIINESFDTGEFNTSKTAVIKFFNKNNRLLYTETFGVVDLHECFSRIKEGKPLNISNCYLHNFSLSDYRDLYGLNKQEMIVVNDITAVNTFFDSDVLTDFSYSHFIGNSADFVNAHFANGNVTFYKSKFEDMDVDFSNVAFGNGDVNFQFTEFGNGQIIFENSSFGDGDALFVNTHFGRGKVNFKNILFDSTVVDFHFAKFEKGDISFDKSIFNSKKVDFKRVEFGDGKLDFTRVHFGDADINFEETEYGKGRVNFKKSIFGKGSVSFQMAEFGDEEVTFENAEFGRGHLSFFKSKSGILNFKSCELNNYLDLRVDKCGRIDLSNTIIKDIIDLKPGFSEVKIDQIDLTGARNLGKIFLNWKENNVQSMILSQKEATTDWQKAEQFRILKEDFSSAGQYNDEDAAYVEFKRHELEHITRVKLKEGGLGKITAWPSYIFQKLIFDKMGLYATDPVRVLVSMFCVYIFFSLLYILLPSVFTTEILTGLSEPEALTNVAKSFYFSAITFFTIGYGDYYPEGILRWFACSEGFSGVFMMSYFVVAFVRKILR
jgi:hypothetical protein